jgi:hypothetical protein
LCEKSFSKPEERKVEQENFGENKEVRVEENEIEKKDENKEEDEEENFAVLIEDFKEASFLQQACLFILNMRIILYVTVTALLFAYPFVQIILMLILGVGMTLYIIIARPFDDIMDMIEQLLYESMSLGINFTILVLASMGIVKSSVSDNTKSRCSEAIIILINISNFTIIAFNYIRIIKICIKVYKKLREYRRQKKLFPSMTLNDFLIKDDKKDTAPQPQQPHNILNTNHNNSSRRLLIHVEQSEYSQIELLPQYVNPAFTFKPTVSITKDNSPNKEDRSLSEHSLSENQKEVVKMEVKEDIHPDKKHSFLYQDFSELFQNKESDFASKEASTGNIMRNRNAKLGFLGMEFDGNLV